MRLPVSAVLKSISNKEMRGKAVLCFVQSKGEYEWFQGRFLDTDSVEYGLLGTLQVNPPQPHDCFKKDMAQDLLFWTVALINHSTGSKSVIRNVQHSGLDSVVLSTVLDPAIFCSDIAPNDHQLHFQCELIKIDQDADEMVDRYFKTLTQTPCLLVIGDLTLQL